MRAGGQTNARLAPATADGLGVWVAEIETVLGRILPSTPLAGFVDVGGVARAVAAPFVRLGLYGGGDGAGAPPAMDALEQPPPLLPHPSATGPPPPTPAP